MKWGRIFILVFCPMLASAQLGFYHTHAQGWHWYAPVPSRVPEKQSLLKPPQQTQYQASEKKMTALKKLMHHRLHFAILNPTRANVANYIALQNYVSHLSSQFAKVWASVLQQSPALNFQLRHPVAQFASQLHTDLKNNRAQHQLKDIAEHKVLLYFYRASCPYCVKFSPILKSFLKNHHLNYIAVTTDGHRLPAFANALQDQGWAQQLHVRAEPAVYLWDKQQGKISHVSYGLLSIQALTRRLLAVDRQQQRQGEVDET